MAIFEVRLEASAFLLVFVAACAPVRRQGDTALKADSGAVQDLEAKLAERFQRYDQARALVIQTVAVEKAELTRDEWESALAAPSELGSQELALLEARQREEAEAARLAASERSVLDLDLLRASGAVREFCHDLPKGGMLHIHPYGTLDRETTRSVLSKVNPKLDFAKLASLLNQPGGTGTLYPDELAEVKKFSAKYATPVPFNEMQEGERAFVEGLFFLPPGSHPFDRFTAVFSLISALLFGSPQVDPEPLVEEAFFARAERHKVRYVEISRFIVPKPSWVQSLSTWAAKVKERYGVTPRYLASFARNKEPGFTRSKAEQLLKLPPAKELPGVNILADETSFPALEFGQTLYGPILGAVDQGTSRLHRTAHAGELGDARNVRDMILMGVERIGHGVKLKDDPVTLEYARRIKLPIEVNLVSNLRLQVVPSMKEHPFLHFLRLGLPVSLSTDDEGIFESTIDDECVHAVEESDVSYDELKRMALNAVRTGFADDATKTQVLAEVDADFAAFETQWAKLRKTP